MARIGMSMPGIPQGKLTIEELFPNCVEVFYIPPAEKLAQSGASAEEADKHRTQIMLINGQDKFITVFPTNTLAGHDDFLKQKYNQIRRITLADTSLWNSAFGWTTPSSPEEVMELLEDLPSGFIKDFDYGLGLAKDYRFIVEAVESLSGCTEIVISKSEPTSISENGEIFTISATDFELARKTLNSITNIGRTAARSVKDVSAYNILAKSLSLPEKTAKSGRHPLRKFLTSTAQGQEPLADDEQEAVLSTITKHTKSIAEAKPESLAKLQGNIELVTLEMLIERYADMMGKKLKENSWQEFFHENPFILNMAFGYPVIKVQDQASVGGRKLSGSGEKVTDFLVKNSLTNNTAIFEIKTPHAVLLNKKPFREGVYTPSAELSGSINQALDQKYQFQSQIAQIKNNSRIYDLESYSVHCSLIIGTMPSGDDQLKSFEIFRRNSKDVEIVTFDELLEKLKQLKDFLVTADGDAENEI